LWRRFRAARHCRQICGDRFEPLGPWTSTRVLARLHQIAQPDQVPAFLAFVDMALPRLHGIIHLYGDRPVTGFFRSAAGQEALHPNLVADMTNLWQDNPVILSRPLDGDLRHQLIDFDEG
jgi:hypothetical protein